MLRLQPLYATGSFARQLGDFPRAVARGEELLALARIAGDEFHAALALLTLGLVAYNRGAQDEARTLLEEALPLFRALGHDHAEAMVLSFLGDVYTLRGDQRAAKAHVERALGIWRSRDDTWGIAIALGHLGNVLRAGRACERAAACYRESLVRRAQLADTLLAADCIEDWASLAASCGQPEWAARPPAHESAYRQAMATARASLGEQSFTTAFAVGHAWTLDQIIVAAAAKPPGNAARRIGLTRREFDVLRLLVEGGSDQEIADSLFVSRRTVTSHVTRILAKLQVSSRTAAATHAVRARLI